MTIRYRVRSFEENGNGEIFAIIDGPGIGLAGLDYAFASIEEMDAFVDLLNDIREHPIPGMISAQAKPKSKRVLRARGAAG